MKNSEVISITSLAYGGDAVGRLSDNRICFVPGALPQEQVEVEIVQDKKRFVRGKVRKILFPAPERITPECPHFINDDCPGCAYIHTTYENELQWKQQQLKDFLLRNNLLDSSQIHPPYASKNRFGMRNKLTLHCQNGVTGYFGRDNRTVFKLEKCLLAQDGLNKLIPAIKNRSGQRIILRQTEQDGAIIVDDAEKMLTETLPGFGNFQVSADGFFQTNTFVAAEMVRLVVEYIRNSGHKKLVELYCGTGIFSICAAENIPNLQCIGIEISEKAIAAAGINAQNHQLFDRCRFFAGDAGKLLKKCSPMDDTVLLLDPPRSGVMKSTLLQIIDSAAAEIIYISCAPDTLTRDLKIFKDSSKWQITESGLLDMFPGTAHFETITRLVRK